MQYETSGLLVMDRQICVLLLDLSNIAKAYYVSILDFNVVYRDIDI